MRTLIFVLAILFAVLQYKLWFGSGGVPDVVHLKKEFDMQIAKNIEIREHNAALQAEVENLKNGHQAIEERARNDLGMVKKGEVFYQVVEKHKRRHRPNS